MLIKEASSEAIDVFACYFSKIDANLVISFFSLNSSMWSKYGIFWPPK